MAQDIFDVKLCELDEKIAKLHGRIHSAGNSGHETLRQEIQKLRRECAGMADGLRTRLEFSKNNDLIPLSRAYVEIEHAIQRMEEECQEEPADGKGEGYLTERKILFAEYALDFAIQAADRALLLSMEAIDAQMTQQEKERSLQ